MTAILAPVFWPRPLPLDPCVLILLCLVLRKLSGFDAGREAIQKLAVIVTYATAINVFFVIVEVFTVFYSRIPADMEHFQYLFIGIDGI